VDLSETEDPSELASMVDFAHNYARPYPSEDYAQQVEIEKPAKRGIRPADGKRRSRLARKRYAPSDAYAFAWSGHHQHHARTARFQKIGSTGQFKTAGKG